MRGGGYENTRVRHAIAILFCAALVCAGAARAQDELSTRLSNDRVGAFEPGTYLAGNMKFTLVPYGGKFLLRFADAPEVYVLYADHASLGGRVLKYDSGETAILVSGWGGMTLYTDAQPAGAPAERVGDTLAPVLNAVTLGEMQNAAEDEAEHLAYARRLKLSFSADWVWLAGDSAIRALAFDTMENAARGLERFAGAPAARATLTQKLDNVRIEPGAKPTIALSGRTLVVTFNTQRGYVGRASSRAIARALGTLLSTPAAK